MNVGREIVSEILRSGDLQPYLDAGLDEAWLKTPTAVAVFDVASVSRSAYQWLLGHYRKHGTVATLDLFQRAYPAASYRLESSSYKPAELIEVVREEVRWLLVNNLLHDTADLHDEGRIEEVVPRLQAAIAGLSDVTAAAAGPRNSWEPVDLNPYLTGDYEPLEPTICMRADGQHLFYRGKTHSLSSETEGGKTWLALDACAQEIDAGHQVLYLDFEDGADGITERLSELVSTSVVDEIERLFHYIRPEGPLTDPTALMELAGRSTFAVIDGITEAMTMHGLNPLDNADVAKFNNLITNPLAVRGPAVLSLDHVVKDPNNRGRYQIGGVHKLNAISGVSYLLENETPFGRGQVGKSRLLVAKDRPGHVRQHGIPEVKQPSKTYVADLILDNRDPVAATELRLTPPAAYGEWRPHHLMARASKLLAAGDERYNKSSLAERMGGNGKNAKDAINYLVADSYAEVSVEGKNHFLVHVKLYTEPEI